MTTTTKPKHNTLYLLFITTITLLIIISAHCSPTSSYPLSYVGVQSGKNLTRLNLEFSRSGLQNVQLIVSNLNNNNDQDSFPKDEMVKVSIGELGIFTTAFNLTQCEKFIVDVDRRTLAPTHIEQFNCNKGNVAPTITITPTATTTPQQARATSIQKAKLQQQQQQASNQQQIVYLRTSLRDSAQQLSKQAGKVSFEGVLTPKTDKEQADQQNNQSFFRKYWYYIVPVVLMLVVSSLGVEDDQQGGRAAAPAQ